MANCVTVRASGRPLDQLCGEASRVSRAGKVNWWRGDKSGTLLL